MSAGSALPHQHTALQQKQEDKTSTKTVPGDVSQTDVAKIKIEADGSWKRPSSTFRNFVEPGGEFPPEKGLETDLLTCRHD